MGGDSRKTLGNFGIIKINFKIFQQNCQIETKATNYKTHKKKYVNIPIFFFLSRLPH